MATIIFPGQGSQFRGMGVDLFSRHPERVREAEEVLGYSLHALVDGPDLDRTAFTQPALFVVNALRTMEWRDVRPAPRFAAGHSLGEYNALYAAGVFDFEVGVWLVAERGRLMARAGAGKMAAVLGWSATQVRAALAELGADEVDLANDNSPTQQVISGPGEAIERAAEGLTRMGAKVIELRVRSPFHSRHMRGASEAFAQTLARVDFHPPRFPVISNVEARPHEHGRVAELLAAQIAAPVRWTESVRYMLEQGEDAFEELGERQILTKMIAEIRSARPQREGVAAAPGEGDRGQERAWERSAEVAPAPALALAPDQLGSAQFRARHGLRFAYAAGAMYKGIASKALVIRLARAGMMAFLGTGGMSLEAVADDLEAIRAALGPGCRCWGANLLASVERPEHEARTVDLFLRAGVDLIEAAAFMRMSPALVRYRVSGLRARGDGGVEIGNRVVAKISRPEVARAFLSPPPAALVDALVAAGSITPAQAQLAARVPMADDLCVEADSGGHTDQGVAGVLLPRMLRLRDELRAEHGYATQVGVGLAGGIGTPEAAAAAFIMGADFIVTGSINQCTVEAGTSDAVKDILETIDVQDVTCAPSGDMFELGAKVQVVRKGTLFPARANRLYSLYQHYESVNELSSAQLRQLEDKYFGRSIDEVWAETARYYGRVDPEVLARAERSAKKRMALIFRWYFVHSTRLALSGDPSKRRDYQIHCGPALGACNRWLAGTALAPWRARRVDALASLLLEETAALLRQRLGWLLAANSQLLAAQPVRAAALG
ncbi:ACP S-malonyltransferase [Pseudenhygromyxa sp. WMMC2535]|uniref:ACP S-malonyltransferase n=1 Tax=Pseudenhygromyxa sp. WMMC2535 TaxID=2712867 RepID=UPI001555E1DD|nr:ACP S-malonyltransferase [Pseudenhygromyxa sp. WMMC2535]NVB41758.1 ACP S-malonyltransferase [Pseudenhygromyxa sp. WMMC2535]